MSRDPRDWQADMNMCQRHQTEEEYEYWTTALEYWLQQVKQLKEDNARWTCQWNGAEQKYLTQSNTLAELRGRAERAEEREQKLKEARPYEEWHEEHGDVLWWEFPIVEPPYCGTPLDGDWPDYHTHWTPIVAPEKCQSSTLYPLDREDTNNG